MPYTQPLCFITRDRFWSKVDKNGPVSDYAPHLGPCWIWTAGLFSAGYGQFWNGSKNVGAHRWAYEQEHGSIPEGLQSDHLCRVRHCVRSSHIELVTQQENIRRGDAGQNNVQKTHCPQAHPYSAENTYRDSDGRRRCRQCNRPAQRRLAKLRSA